MKTTKVIKKNGKATRMSEITADLARPKDNLKPVNSKSLKTRYNIKGLTDIKVNDNDATAIDIRTGRDVVYKVKIANNGKVFNPNNISGSYGLDRNEKPSGSPMFKFREVTERCFTAYLQFLKTNNDSYLSICEREI